MDRCAYLSLVLGLLLIGATAAAQDVPVEQFNADRFVPAAGPDNFLAVDGAVVGGHMTPSGGLLIDYAHRPLMVKASSCTEDDVGCSAEEIDVVAYDATGTLMGSISFIQRIQVGLAVPLTAVSGDTYQISTPGLDQPYLDLRGGSAFGLGDPRLSVKGRVVGKGRQGFSLAIIGFLAPPLGQATAGDHWMGDDGFQGGGHLAAEFRVERIRVAANLGGAYRPDAQLLAVEVGPEMIYGVAGGFEVTPTIEVLGEFTGATQFSSEGSQNPLEFRVAGELSAGDFAIKLGGGAGLNAGVTVPTFRVLAGVGYHPAGLDTDGDGVGDRFDACPSEPEDRDGYVDDDGCPDVDNDSDGFDDTVDKCPDEPEDVDGTEDDDGCRDPDNDGDGIEDGYDSCPEEPEDKDGDRDEDGCPDNDRDRDGVADDVDKCPDEPEDTDGYGDEDGCPETDFDGDQIPDDEDFCPDQAEDLNGVDDQDGCPETPPAEEPAAAPAAEPAAAPAAAPTQ